MARKPRIFIDGAIYHVYCRTARALRAFEDPDEADAFVDLLREVKQRDGLTVYAWSVMPTHYHIALATSSVPLSKTMHAIQGRFSAAYNRRKEATGAFWQGRFRAQMVATQAYVQQLVFYIHLNPVKAGIVDDAASYRWSGHRELLGRASTPLVDVDDALFLFGRGAREARADYLKRLEVSTSSRFAMMDTTKLPWWVSDEEHLLQPAQRGPAVDELGRSSEPETPRVALQQFVSTACDVLQVQPELLVGRSRIGPLVFVRRVMATVGVYDFSLKTSELASYLGRHPDSVSRIAVEGLRQRRHDAQFRRACEELQWALSPQRRGPFAGQEGDAERVSSSAEDPDDMKTTRPAWVVWD